MEKVESKTEEVKVEKRKERTSKKAKAARTRTDLTIRPDLTIWRNKKDETERTSKKKGAKKNYFF